MAAMSGCSMNASTTSLSPLTTLNTPGGSPASVHSSASRSDSDGTRSDGFITKVLPHAIATGAIHIGIIAGKLNGPIPAHTPSGWRNDQPSTPRATPSGVFALEQLRNSGRELDDFDATHDRAARVVEHLAVLRSDQPCQLVEVLVDQALEVEHDARATHRRRRRPAFERLLGRRDRGRDVGARGHRHLARLGAERRIEDAAIARRRALRPSLPFDVVLQFLGHVYFCLRDPSARHWQAVRPPSTYNTWPVTKSEAGRKKNRAGPTISFGCRRCGRAGCARTAWRWPPDLPAGAAPCHSSRRLARRRSR